MKKLYAAYGSNLNVAQMRFRCPDAVSITTGWLRGHELVFRGRPNGAVATIEPQEKSCVPVALWYISEGDEQALDIYEGYPHFYTKEQMTFSTPQGDVSAIEGHTERWYAERTGMPQKTVHNRKCAALKKLRRHISQEV